MDFKFHLYIRKHANNTYTVTPIPFYDLTVFGPNIEELKRDLQAAVKERLEAMAPAALEQVQFDPQMSLRKVEVVLRPVDRKNRKKRREQVPLIFSLLVKPDPDSEQLIVSVPRLGTPPLTFYAYSRAELDTTAQQEIAAWLDDDTLEDLQQYRHARSEYLEVLEVEAEIRKAKDRSDSSGRFMPGLSDSSEESHWALKEVGIDITAQAAEGRFRRAYHRDKEVEDILHILKGQRHNSVLVTGPSESGKTAVINEVIRRINSKDCDEALHGRSVWLITPDRIIAGAQFVGTWEERLNNIVDECRKKRHILYMPDLPGFLEVGRWSKSDANVAMALKPHIIAGDVTIIGESSPERLTMGENTGPSFINLFRKVEVEALSEEETLLLMGNVARDLERDLNIRVLPDAYQTAVQLSRRFWPYRSFPGKAIRLLEETATDIAQRNTQNSGAANSLFRRIGNARIGRQDVIETFSRTSGMPEFVVNDAARMALDEVENYFVERLIGQEEAVAAMVDLVAMVKSGLTDPHKPLGTFLFIGPTGVGKTQMAKTLASYLFGDENRLIRFDMSEYSAVDGVERLIGAFDRDGELTRRVREQPFSVVLLDEFEKASPRIYDIFLQVLGEGRLTDAAGKTTFFHNAILILTSNLGGTSKAARAPGFAVGEQADPKVINEALREHYMTQIEQYFRPEFINRLDKIVVFGQLTPQAVRDIARRELNEVLTRDGITRRNILVEMDEAVIDMVLEHGYSPEYGARPLKREIERRVVAPMARALAEHSSEDQNLLRVSMEDGQLKLKTVPIGEADQARVTLAGALESATGRRQRMDLAELVEGYALLRRKLADWASSELVQTMMREKEELLQATHTQQFWEDNDEARASMRRFYFLDRLTRRVSQLQERVEYLEDLAVLVNRERDLRYLSDLARDYEKLYTQVSFLDIELLTSRLPHRNQAMLLITLMGTQTHPPEQASDEWPRRLSEMYLWWAERKGYDREIYLLTPDPKAPGGSSFVQIRAGNFPDVMKRYARYGHTDEIALWFEGSNVFGFLKGERGLHRLVGNDAPGDELAQVRVFALPDETNVTSWLADYQRIKTDIAEGRQPPPAQEKHVVIRAYSLDRSDRYIRDMRTGVRTTNVKDVMGKGHIDEFILALLKSDEANSMSWEDRNPPTFPFGRR